MADSPSFSGLRNDLDILIAKWQKDLPIILNKVPTKGGEDNAATRYAMLLEYNRFMNMLDTMKWLVKDTEAIGKDTKKVGTVLNELYNQSVFENVGRDIGMLIDKVEDMIKDDSVTTHVIGVNIKRCIYLLRHAHDVCARKEYDELIDRLNKCIIAKNKQTQVGESCGVKPTGIILQLGVHHEHEHEHDFIRDTAVIYTIECLNCKHLFDISGCIDLDVYAPSMCPMCKSCDLSKSKKSLWEIKRQHKHQYTLFPKKQTRTGIWSKMKVLWNKYLCR